MDIPHAPPSEWPQKHTAFRRLENRKREKKILVLHLPSTYLIGRKATEIINDAEQPAVPCSLGAQGSHCHNPTMDQGVGIISCRKNGGSFSLKVKRESQRDRYKGKGRFIPSSTR